MSTPALTKWLLLRNFPTPRLLYIGALIVTDLSPFGTSRHQFGYHAFWALSEVAGSLFLLRVRGWNW